MILLRDHAPGARALGTTNGLAQLCMSGARALSPAFVSALFALSLGAGTHAWAVGMAAVAVGGAVVARRIVRAEDGAYRPPYDAAHAVPME
jgi:hypothetical protein